MANIPLKMLLFVAGALVAGTGTAYFAGAFDPAAKSGGETPIAAAPNAPADPGQGDGDSPAAGMGTGVLEGAEKQDRAEGEQEVVVPAFDILRAEPDGSLVVAGRAAPGAEVQVLSGSSVLATTTAGPSGDFAAVLDRALKPGSHNIVLRATSSENVAATSVETAVVSIPSGDGGEVVALVQEPGQPSRLISVPDHEEQAEHGSASETRDREAAEATVKEDRPEQETSREQQADVLAEARPSDPDGKPASEQETQATAETAPEGEPQDASGAQAGPFIEAVEIDGREVFVAGKAEPGRRLRVYVNDILLGQTMTGPEGRFLVQTERDLPVGDYVVRADVLDDDDVTVIARAAVPFERHTGDKIAAVAPNPAGKAAPAEAGTGSGTSDRSAARRNGGKAPAATENPMGEGIVAEAPRVTRPGGDGAVEMAPPLESADGAVIIRRGDTLWHISRRVYGRGMRYTTIYRANQDQIRNPDRIWPGQIFALPEKTKEGEEADLGAIKGQSVSPEQAAGGQAE